MGCVAMLTDTEIKKAKAGEKPKKLSDGGGLFLLVTVQGSKLWRLAYRFNGKQKTLCIGEYPIVSLLDARTKREEAKRQLFNDIDPSSAKQAVKAATKGAAANSFELIAREWFASRMLDKSESHKKRAIRLLEKNLFPDLGKKSITELKPADMLETLRKIEDRNTIDTAHKAFNLCSQIMRYAVQTQRAERDISQD